jgi:hypothetical protein
MRIKSKKQGQKLTNRSQTKNKRAERFLAAQADQFAGANWFRKIGLLRSE